MVGRRRSWRRRALDEVVLDGAGRARVVDGSPLEEKEDFELQIHGAVVSGAGLYTLGWSPQGYTRSGEFETIDAGNVSLPQGSVDLWLSPGKEKGVQFPPRFLGTPRELLSVPRLALPTLGALS